MRKTITTLILAAAALGTAAVLADAGPADAATINGAGNGSAMQAAGQVGTQSSSRP